MANEQDVMMNQFPEASDGKYFYLESEDGKQVKVTKASVASVISQVIKDTPNALANVNFGAKTSAELASVVAGQLSNNIFTNTQLESLDNTLAFSNRVIYANAITHAGVAHYGIIICNQSGNWSANILYSTRGILYRILSRNGNTITVAKDWTAIV